MHTMFLFYALQFYKMLFYKRSNKRYSIRCMASLKCNTHSVVFLCFELSRLPSEWIEKTMHGAYSLRAQIQLQDHYSEEQTASRNFKTNGWRNLGIELASRFYPNFLSPLIRWQGWHDEGDHYRPFELSHIQWNVFIYGSRLDFTPFRVPPCNNIWNALYVWMATIETYTNLRLIDLLSWCLRIWVWK